MADTIVIAPELPFKQQISELAAQAARSLPQPDQKKIEEFISSFEEKIPESAEEVTDEKKKDVVKQLVEKYVELRGGIDGPKEADAESSHLLLQFVLASTFGPSSEEYSTLVKKVNEAVKKGAEESSKTGRIDAAARILNNTYNSLPSSSPLRPSTLLTLLSLLSNASDLSSLPLTESTLTSALNTWSISPEEKTQFLTSASEIYQSSDLTKSLNLLVLAMKQSSSPKSELIDKAILVALAIPTKFEVDDVLRVEGVDKVISGKSKEIAGLFEGDEIETVQKGKSWLSSNASYIESAGIAGFTAEKVLTKLRLVALVAIASKSESRQLSYGPIAQALAIEESEVEAWVIDAIRSKLIVARISQPLSIVKITSISSSASSSRRFGTTEWKLLEKRLEEWKKAVGEARQVIEEAEGIAQQGLGVQRRTNTAGGGGGGRRERGEGQQQQQQQQQQQEVAA